MNDPDDDPLENALASFGPGGQPATEDERWLHRIKMEERRVAERRQWGRLQGEMAVDMLRRMAERRRQIDRDGFEIEDPTALLEPEYAEAPAMPDYDEAPAMLDYDEPPVMAAFDFDEAPSSMSVECDGQAVIDTSGDDGPS